MHNIGLFKHTISPIAQHNGTQLQCLDIIDRRNKKAGLQAIANLFRILLRDRSHPNLVVRGTFSFHYEWM